MAETNGSLRWQTLAAVATVVILAAGAIVQFGSLSSQVLAGADANRELLEQVRDLSQRLGDQRAEITSIKMALKEIETQFCAMGNDINLNHARDQRDFAVLWDKVMTSQWHTDNSFYPVVCNRHPDN